MKEASIKGGRRVLLIVRGSVTNLPTIGTLSDYVTFSSRVEMPALVVGLSL